MQRLGFENNDQEKRRFYIKEQNIDIAYLLNENMLLTEKELSQTLPTSDYHEYITNYSTKKIKTFFYNNYNKNWFFEKYLIPQKRNFGEEIKNNFPIFESFIRENGIKSSYLTKITQTPKFYCIADDIPENISIDQIATNLNIDSNKFFTIQGDNLEKFRRQCYVLFDSMEVAKEFSEKVKNVINLQFFPIKIKEFFIKESRFKIKNENLELKIVKFLDYFNKKYGTNFDLEDLLKKLELNEELTTILKINFGVLLLRKVFNFCVFCVKEFENEIELNLKCGDYHILCSMNNENKITTETEIICDERKKFERKVELSFQKNLFGNAIELESECSIYSKIMEDNLLKCVLCGEILNNNTLEHLQEFHYNEFDEIKNFVNDFETFVGKIGFFEIQMFNGTNRDSLPDFINENELKGIKYDFNGVFSGEIKL